jgi:hypothetical protein
MVGDSIATPVGNGAPSEIKEWQAIMDHLAFRKKANYHSSPHPRG